MRIHTNDLSLSDLQKALDDSGLCTDGVRLGDVSRHASRSHRRAYEVTLRAAHGKDRNGKTRRWPNGGSYGADTTYGKAATYDEWGYFLSELFDRDPEMMTRDYADAQQFHEHTAWQFAPSTAATVPADEERQLTRHESRY